MACGVNIHLAIECDEVLFSIIVEVREEGVMMIEERISCLRDCGLYYSLYYAFWCDEITIISSPSKWTSE